MKPDSISIVSVENGWVVSATLIERDPNGQPISQSNRSFVFTDLSDMLKSVAEVLVNGVKE